MEDSITKEIETIFWGQVLPEKTKQELIRMIQFRIVNAQINIVEYYDQVPSNDVMDWKSLFADNLGLFKADLKELNDK